MRLYYCKKCKINNASPVCASCGAALSTTAANERYGWRIAHTPLGDMHLVGRVLKRVLLWGMLLLVLLLLGEIASEPDKSLVINMLLMGGLLPQMLIALGCAVGGTLLLLGLQGREEMEYSADATGVIQKIWIEPSRVKCLSRMVPYDPGRFLRDADGRPWLLVSETRIQWTDVKRYQADEAGGRILLYRPDQYLFLVVFADKADMRDLCHLAARKVPPEARR